MKKTTGSRLAKYFRAMVAFNRALTFISLILVSVIYFCWGVYTILTGEIGLGMFILVILLVVVFVSIVPTLFALDYTHKNAFKRKK